MLQPSITGTPPSLGNRSRRIERALHMGPQPREPALVGARAELFKALSHSPRSRSESHNRQRLLLGLGATIPLALLFGLVLLLSSAGVGGAVSSSSAIPIVGTQPPMFPAQPMTAHPSLAGNPASTLEQRAASAVIPASSH